MDWHVGWHKVEECWVIKVGGQQFMAHYVKQKKQKKPLSSRLMIHRIHSIQSFWMQNTSLFGTDIPNMSDRIWPLISFQVQLWEVWDVLGDGICVNSAGDLEQAASLAPLKPCKSEETSEWFGLSGIIFYLVASEPWCYVFGLVLRIRSQHEEVWICLNGFIYRFCSV